MQAQAQAIIIGGGAAGFFAAIRLAEVAPQLGVTILEASAQTLSKVRISGGGRCNVTHDCLQPKDLVHHYPRGERELRGPFHHFGAAETIGWFAQRGVELKTEADGRMFPTTDNSETIVQALSQAAQTAGVTVHTKTAVTAIERSATGFSCHTAKHRFAADACLVATGGSPKGQALLASLGVPLVPGVPSLFTAHCPVPWLHTLAGISVPDASVTLRAQGETITGRGPLLCTHRGLSGPAMLRASAWGARLLHGVQYRCDLIVNWLASENAQQLLIQYQSENGAKLVSNVPAVFPKRLWATLVEQCAIPAQRCWSQIRKSERADLIRMIEHCVLPMNGKATNKDEFVTAGGVDRRAIDWKRMAVKEQPGLYVAGECMDVDAITGGFNFQNAWTTGFMAANAIAKALSS